jgi:hypothetical protein
VAGAPPCVGCEHAPNHRDVIVRRCTHHRKARAEPTCWRVPGMRQPLLN